MKDSSPTIALKDQKILFEQYRRTDSAKSGKQRGWGLGLALVNGLADAHGGSVRVESTLDAGLLPEEPDDTELPFQFLIPVA
ncbi:MAG: hypothetical protein H7222_09735 [Methylotenera sp.]|nr:hypothetical protein [Oligoflexia bacterium]